MKFSEITKNATPTLIDFYAPWCGPCKAMSPVLSEVAGAVGDSAKIIKIDVDQHQALSRKLGIRGVPTFILYKEGKIIWRGSGMQSKTELVSLINSANGKQIVPA